MKNDKDNKSMFSAVVETPNDGDITVDVEFTKNECCLTYDEVEDAIYNKLGYILGINSDDEYLYKCKIISIVINDGDECYPVLNEDDDETELKKSKVYSKYLVLPWATYALTPEAKLWMNLKENGIIDEDAPFDFEKYHNIIEERKN